MDKPFRCVSMRLAVGVIDAVPGYEVLRQLGQGGSGEVWLARDIAAGDLVALKSVRANDRHAAAREAALLSSIEHEHVLRLRSTVDGPNGLLLVLDYAAGGSLADLLAARGTLSPGEVVTLGSPLAHALAAIHLRGLVHGDVAPGNVLFTADGKPLLADLGVSRVVGEARVPGGVTAGFADPAGWRGAASDIYGLAAICRAALLGEAPIPTAPGASHPLPAPEVAVPQALLDAIDAALAPNPAGRPTPQTFAAQLLRACHAEPIRLARPGSPGARGSGPVTHRVMPSQAASPQPETRGVRRPAGFGWRHRLSRASIGLKGRLSSQTWRRIAAGGVVALMLIGAVLIGLAWAARDVPPVGSVPAAPPSLPPHTQAPAGDRPTDWWAVLSELDALRSSAFAECDERLLERVYAPGSAAFNADRSRLAELSAVGASASGLRLTLLDVTEDKDLSASDGRVVLSVVDELPDYTLVGPDGVEQHRTGRGRATWLVTLQEVEEGQWRIADIRSGERSGNA